MPFWVYPEYLVCGCLRYTPWLDEPPIASTPVTRHQVQPALDALKEASLPETAEVQSVLLEIFQEIRQFFAADHHDEMGLVGTSWLDHIKTKVGPVSVSISMGKVHLMQCWQVHSALIVWQYGNLCQAMPGIMQESSTSKWAVVRICMTVLYKACQQCENKSHGDASLQVPMSLNHWGFQPWVAQNPLHHIASTWRTRSQARTTAWRRRWWWARVDLPAPSARRPWRNLHRGEKCWKKRKALSDTSRWRIWIMTSWSYGDEEPQRFIGKQAKDIET